MLNYNIWKLQDSIKSDVEKLINVWSSTSSSVLKNNKIKKQCNLGHNLMNILKTLSVIVPEVWRWKSDNISRNHTRESRSILCLFLII